MRVLLVEDEEQIADFVTRGLSEQGYAVDIAYDGDEARHWPDVAEFDVIILGLMLPKRNGIEVCRSLRERGIHTPVIMLTAKDAVEDRVLGLDSGADDYFVKPFAFAELLARLRNLTRREPAVLADAQGFRLAFSAISAINILGCGPHVRTAQESQHNGVSPRPPLKNPCRPVGPGRSDPRETLFRIRPTGT